MPEIPDKSFYRIGEVCDLTDTQPYVLRFWESEFPQLTPRKNRSGHRVYRREEASRWKPSSASLYCLPASSLCSGGALKPSFSSTGWTQPWIA